jgi:hypothetical protein
MDLTFVSSIKAPLYDPSIKRGQSQDFTFEKLEAFFRICLPYRGPKEKWRMYLCAKIKPFNDCKKRWDNYYLPQSPTTGAGPFIISAPDLPVFDVTKELPLIPQLSKPKPKQQAEKQIEATEELLEYATKCLYNFDPDDEDDRFMTACAMCQTFADPAFADRAETAWQDWYRQATNWTDTKAGKKWHDAGRTDAVTGQLIAPEISIAFVLRKRPSKVRKAADKQFKEQLVAGGFNI